MPDTIHALSSGALPSGVAVIRLSGPQSLPILQQMLQCSKELPPRRFMLRSIFAAKSSELLDRALVVTFPGPHSFTGEDIAELHVHGSPAVVAAVLQQLTLLGSRPADPGEFTRRAFLNGQMDLTQAEALADLIDAETEAQRQLALSNSSGRLRQKIDSWRQSLIRLMADIEADLDFADEADVSPSTTTPAIRALASEIDAALAGAPLAERIRHGLRIVIVGPPNAGKSSLLNALAQRDAAIVTPVAGTTRDSIEIALNLAGRAVSLIDTAGIHETTDLVESIGIARSHSEARRADLLLDMGANMGGANPTAPNLTAPNLRAPGHLPIVNKIDLYGLPPGIRGNTAYLSTKTGAGLAALESWLTDWALAAIPQGEPPLLTHARHVALLRDVSQNLQATIEEPDLVLKAELLRQAALALGRLTGRIDPETVLDQIFSRFCIGK